MSSSAAHAQAFFDEVVQTGILWGLREAVGFVVPEPNEDGFVAMPFWSGRSRAERIVENVPAYRSFEPAGIPLDAWKERWLPGLERDGYRVGLNWSGKTATGYDFAPDVVLERLRVAER